MGVDYDANYGVGYEVVENEELSGTEEVGDGLSDYLFDNCSDGFKYFEVGNAYNDDSESKCFLVVKNPFENGLNLESVKERLDKELERLRLESCGDFGAVGGLNVW